MWRQARVVVKEAPGTDRGGGGRAAKGAVQCAALPVGCAPRADDAEIDGL